MNIGALYLGKKKCRFTVWAPAVDQMTLKIVSAPQRDIVMKSLPLGYWQATVADILPGALYFYHSPSFGDKPDPASLSQPQGVHGPSQVVDHSRYQWQISPEPQIKLKDMIIYELHIGTFTSAGTFAGAVEKLDYLCALGITAVEVMPVAQCPGERNWGYDGVYPFAVQQSYGGVEEFKKFVDECHRRKLAVVLDVVYNHLGPEGNYLSNFGPYFTDKYKTPWGWAINFDDAYSDDVRNYFIQNALDWFRNFHVDALRLDAVHAIFDHSAKPFLKELAEKTEALSASDQRKYYLIAESDLNDSAVIRPIEQGGLGLDAQWSDDFHHAMHAVLTQERAGYYQDFGAFEQIVKALEKTFVYNGQYSGFRKRQHGNSADACRADQFVIALQNHDQVGNRMKGDRLSTLTSFESLKSAAGLMMMSPYLPLIFMGEEYAEENPFLYFVNHGDEALIEAVRRGRKEEFKGFLGQGEPPDPQAIETYQRSKLNWARLGQQKHAQMLKFYQALIVLRQKLPALKNLDKTKTEITADMKNKIIFLRRWQNNQQVLSIVSFSAKRQSCSLSIASGTWQKIIDSTQAQWGGAGESLPQQIKSKQIVNIAPESFAAYRQEKK
ncbi:MAG: malto-oligosyltrehalose trehalohydrolase [Candidatus Omnitrophica bacterium]|nr:malto-oligosyltrehalose trehalohydrolase [Candidatus Omnitrophota bacterium]